MCLKTRDGDTTMHIHIPFSYSQGHKKTNDEINRQYHRKLLQCTAKSVVFDIIVIEIETVFEYIVP